MAYPVSIHPMTSGEPGKVHFSKAEEFLTTALVGVLLFSCT